MGKNPSPRSGKPSRPYRGGHGGRGGAHEKGGCAVVALVLGGAASALLAAGYGAFEALRSVI